MSLDAVKNLREALAWIYNNVEPDAIKHRDYEHLAAGICEIAKTALDGEFCGDMHAAETYDLLKAREVSPS